PRAISPPAPLSASLPPRAAHSSPTRRSSDLEAGISVVILAIILDRLTATLGAGRRKAPRNATLRSSTDATSAENAESATGDDTTDRKSTRLNSSHVKSSYAVFCLKKKKQPHPNTDLRQGKALALGCANSS